MNKRDPGEAVNLIEVLEPRLMLAGSEWPVRSPGGQVVGMLSLDGAGAPIYRVQRAGAVVLDWASMGIVLAGANGDLSRGLHFVAQTSRTIDETFGMVSGKTSVSRNRASETTITFRSAGGGDLQVIARAYDDGFAYRYRLVGSGARAVVSEASAFRVPIGSTGWMQPYVSDYEAFYSKGRVGTQFTAGEYGFPGLFQTPAGTWALLTEADVHGSYGAARLAGSGTLDGVFRLKLPDAQTAGTLPWLTPWRVAVAGTLDTVVRSTLVENLNPPAPIADTSWIKPGRVSWSWWSDHNSATDFNKQKAYVDFAASMGWEYTLVDEKWNASWMPSLVSYATRKNVGIILWSHWQDLDTPAERNAKLPLWRSWGVRGIKVDFMLSDAQPRMKFYDDITSAALTNRIMINFHGGTIPRGQRRTHPNVMTHEAVRGAEHYTFNNPPTPAHNTVLPFTRNAIGPMDYTPVTFSAPNKRTTNAHELALAVVFESGWQHFADSIASYNASPARPFLQATPASWDETRLLTGYPGEFAALARRSATQWFIGAINASTPRTLNIPLAFLGSGSYAAEIYRDGTTPSGIVVERRTVTAGTTLTVYLPANGGYAVRLAPVTQPPPPPPPPPPPTGGLTGTYFDNTDFTGRSVSRTDATLNFNWPGTSPAPGIASTTFSARWTGYLTPPASGTYTLHTLSDDGVRVWLDGRLVIDNWTAHAPTENRAVVALEAGRRHAIKVEYFQNFGGATMSLMWSTATMGRQSIPSTALTPA
jgi:alpha-glucosidase